MEPGRCLMSAWALTGRIAPVATAITRPERISKRPADAVLAPNSPTTSTPERRSRGRWRVGRSTGCPTGELNIAHEAVDRPAARSRRDVVALPSLGRGERPSTSASRSCGGPRIASRMRCARWGCAVESACSRSRGGSGALRRRARRSQAGVRLLPGSSRRSGPSRSASAWGLGPGAGDYPVALPRHGRARACTSTRRSSPITLGRSGERCRRGHRRRRLGPRAADGLRSSTDRTGGGMPMAWRLHRRMFAAP